MTTYSHLIPEAAAALKLPPIDRARFALDTRFIVHDGVQRILNRVEFLVLKPQTSRAGGVVVSAPPGSGKSSFGDYVYDKFSGLPTKAEGRTAVPTVVITMSEAGDAKAIYTRALEKLGCPNPERYSGPDREFMVMKLARAAGVRLLIIDEIQDLFEKSDKQRAHALITLKHLMNELRIPLLVLGDDSAAAVIDSQPHLKARFHPESLPTWEPNTELAAFLRLFESTLPLPQPSHLGRRKTMELLVELSKGILGPLSDLLKNAAAQAIGQGDPCITAEHLQTVHAEPPLFALKGEPAGTAAAAADEPVTPAMAA